MIFSLIVLAIAALFFGVFSFAVYLFTPPKNFPKNIPTIPFYYALLPLFKDCDQAELYKQYMKEPLEKYGAVKIFFGGRWNILVRKPAYIAEVFKHEDIYAKSGNQVKIPHSLLGEYTGDNIISAHGKNWKLYSSLIKPTLQRDHDTDSLWKNARKLKNMLLEDSKRSPNGQPVYGLLQRYALANLSEVLLGTSFDTLERTDAPLHALQTKIKPIIFDPVFLNFPVLDHFPFKSRQAGRELARSFRKGLRDHIAKSHEGHECSPESQDLGCRLLGSRREGLITEKQLCDNFVSVFLAGHENPQLTIMCLLYLLGSHTDVQDAARQEINKLFASTSDPEPTYASIHDLPLLTSIIYESIRMFPPISQLINRCTNQPINLGGEIHIPAGTYVGYNGYSTNRDTDFWGKDADEFKPSRWGSTMEEIQSLYRRANSKGAFISFHGGRRACLGQKFALQQLRITIVELLRSMRWELDEKWPNKMTPVSDPTWYTIECRIELT
jgi:unspecific monooxygenase